MLLHLRKTVLVTLSFTVVALMVLLIGAGSASPVTAAMNTPRPRPTPTLRPDSSFIMLLNMRAPYHTDPSYLVRGGAAGPAYVMFDYYVTTSFYVDNRLHAISVNGFQGNVTLQVLNLPPGITSEMPASVFVPIFSSTFVPVRLRASTSAALGNVSGVIIRGTSGSIIRNELLPPFTVVDQLPPLPL